MTQPLDYYYRFRTADELAFLTMLGTYCTRPKDRGDLLKQYLLAAKHRANWGQINKETVVAAAVRMLKARETLRLEHNLAEWRPMKPTRREPA
ncbi:hypothetical protein LCGC14_1505690 [marine sediment metagenome]|uniref:Uncharacterized protein n=1 Tax=marine sediment metagenome TaxID=412755 RepID=A0A0F9LI49_9ZZZZ